MQIVHSFLRKEYLRSGSHKESAGRDHADCSSFSAIAAWREQALIASVRWGCFSRARARLSAVLKQASPASVGSPVRRPGQGGLHLHYRGLIIGAVSGSAHPDVDGAGGLIWSSSGMGSRYQMKNSAWWTLLMGFSVWLAGSVEAGLEARGRLGGGGAVAGAICPHFCIIFSFTI